MTLGATEALGACPSCRGRQFTRASLFAAGRFEREQGRGTGHDALAAAARAELPGSGRFLAFEDAGELRVVALDREHTRIGRSLTAEIRFDDATVSRRHAIVVLEEGAVRILDDRSLNGVFVNGARVETHVLADGDLLVIGRHRLCFLEVVDTPSSAEGHALSGDSPTAA